MFDYARVQVVSSNGLMMLTHEKDPSNNLLPFFDLSFFASSNTAFDRTSGRESHRSQRFFLNCIVRWVAKFCGSPDAGQRGVELNRARRGSGEDLVDLSELPGERFLRLLQVNRR